MAALHQFDVVHVRLDPTQGSEMRGTRPCVIIQTNAGMAGKTVLVAPLTSQQLEREFPFHVLVKKSRENGLAVDSKMKLEQVRCVAVERLGKKIGNLEKPVREDFFKALDVIFDRRQDFQEGWQI